MGELAPLDRLVTLPEGVPALTLGWAVVRWMMTYLRQPNGTHAGKPFRPVESQVRFLLWWYSLDEMGRWLFRRAVRRLAKGSGKSPFAAALALVEFCGPVRLKDFDSKVPGGCVGKPVDMPLVQVFATAEQQTANTMRMVRAFAPKKSKIVLAYDLDVGKEKYFIPPEGTLEQRTSSAVAAEGAEATSAIADETENWRPGNGGVELGNTLVDNLAKSGSRLVETCNAWVPGQDSVAESSWAAWVAQEEGRTAGETRILYDARIAPPDTDMGDRASLMRALEHVYDDCFWVPLDAIIERVLDVSSKASDSQRKYLNRPHAADDAWTTLEEFSQLARPDETVADREPIAMFFDGSKTRDATGLVGCRISDGHCFVLGVYEPNPSHDTEDEVPADLVNSWVARAFERYEPVGFFGDVREWESFVKLSWPEAYGDRLLISAVPKGKDPQKIAWDMRSHVYDFGLACELTKAEIAAHSFTTDGSSTLTRHVVNARNRPSRRFGVELIGKESPSSPRKIDLAVCMVGARMVRRLVLASPAWKKRTRHSAGRGRAIVLR